MNKNTFNVYLYILYFYINICNKSYSVLLNKMVINLKYYFVDTKNNSFYFIIFSCLIRSTILTVKFTEIKMYMPPIKIT